MVLALGQPHDCKTQACLWAYKRMKRKCHKISFSTKHFHKTAVTFRVENFFIFHKNFMKVNDHEMCAIQPSWKQTDLNGFQLWV